MTSLSYPRSELHQRCIAIMSKRHFTTVDGETVTTTQVIAATPTPVVTDFTGDGDGDDYESFFPDDPIEITVQVGTIDDSGEVVEPSGPSITGTGGTGTGSGTGTGPGIGPGIGPSGVGGILPDLGRIH